MKTNTENLKKIIFFKLFLQILVPSSFTRVITVFCIDDAHQDKC